VALFLVADGCRDLLEGVAPVDDRADLAVLDEVGQRGQVPLLAGVPDRVRDDEALGHERRQRERREHAIGGPHPAAGRAADDHEPPPRGQYPPAGPHRAAARDVHDEVVPPSGPGEVLRAVVDDLVRADRPDQIRVPRG
jgi:hypothetical protein